MAAWIEVPALVLILLLPGWLMTRALWPERRVRNPLDLLATVALSLGLSVAIVITVGGILGFLPHGDYGWYRPWTMTIGLLAVCGALLVWGVQRGAYTHVRLRRKPAASREPVAARR